MFCFFLNFISSEFVTAVSLPDGFLAQLHGSDCMAQLASQALVTVLALDSLADHSRQTHHLIFLLWQLLQCCLQYTQS